MDRLAAHLAYLEAAIGAARAAPLSSRKAWLAVMLADAYADRLLAADDILEFRAGLAAASPALELIFKLCAMRAGGPRLVVEAVGIPLAEYGQLGVADFMVSLYNDHSVERVRIALPDGGRRDVHEVLAEAVAALRERSQAGTGTASTG